MNLRRLWDVSGIAVLLLVGCVCTACARPTVMVGNQIVMRFANNPKVNANQRAALVQSMVNAALRRRYPASSIVAVKKKGMWTVVWGTLPVCTVDAASARANQSSEHDLAVRWVTNLRRAVRAAMLTVLPDHVVLAIGASRDLRIGGVSSAVPQVEVGGGEGVRATLSGDVLTVVGTALGQYTLVVTRDGQTVTVPVAVKKPAGSIPQHVYQSITGAPAERDLLDEAVMLAVRGNLQIEAGAGASIAPGAYPVTSLSPGTSTTVPVTVTIAGPDYLTVTRTVLVTLKDEVFELASPSLLMVSNRPERIYGEGVLFSSKFHLGQATRLLFSHQNALPTTQYLWVNVTNTADQPARLHVIAADGGPARQELYVGHCCNARFLDCLAHDDGLILTLPPHSTWCLGQYRVPHGQVVSGLAHLQLMQGRSVQVTVETSADPSRVGQIVKTFNAPFNPFRIHPRGVFATPDIELDSKYVVGSARPDDIAFGKAPWLIDPASGEPNTGNYGVLYSVHLDLENPTDQPQRVTIYFQPLNGVALGSFLFEGKVVQTNCLKPPARGRIGSVELAPGQSRQVEIVTLPQAGSHYPARLVIESTQQETGRVNGDS